MNKKGFTLIELLLSIAVGSIIMGSVFSLLTSNTRLYSGTSKEFDLQSQVRYASEVINNNIKNSTVAFAVMDDHFMGKAEGLTEKWDYIGVSEDKDEIINFIWNGSKEVHEKNILVPKRDGYFYNIEFSQDIENEHERLISYTFTVYNNENKREVIEMKTSIEAINAIQIVDRGLHSVDKAVALAYRTDPTPKAEEQHALIAMVLDTSGSMAWNMSGFEEGKWGTVLGDFKVNGVSQKEGDVAKGSWNQYLVVNKWYHNRGGNLYVGYGNDNNPKGEVVSNEDVRRISILKRQAKDLVDSFAENNIAGNIRLIDFNSLAHYKTDWLEILDEKQTLKYEINKLSASGGTNTGDGLRLAYYAIDEKNKTLKGTNKEVRNYLIILVDGVTTYYSSTQKNTKNFYTQSGNQNRYYRGKGHSLDSDGEEYVKLIGNMIKNSDNNITPFIIGFSDKWENNKYVELESVNTIAGAVGIAEEHHFDIKKKDNPVKDNPKYVFWAKDEESLKNVFESISRTIEADFWQVSGPDN